VSDFAAWAALDYLSRGLPLGAAAWMLRTGRLSRADLGLTFPGWRAFGAHTLVLCLFAALMITKGEDLAAALLPDAALGDYPIEQGTALYFYDLFFGLIIVAVSEEVLSRGLALSALTGLWGRRAAPVFLASAAIFALLHWSGGPRSLAVAFVFGLAFMATPWRTGSVLPPVAAHYLADLIAFW
jgi:membrane protease YdiL (CAAX protease family)